MSPERLSGEDDLRAAEFAMGLLTGPERAEAARRSSRDPAFAAAVTAWEIRLAGLARSVEPVPPRAAVKRALLGRLFGAPRAPLLRRAWVWQAISGASLAALALVIALGLGPRAPQDGPLYTAQIVAEAGDFRVVAVVDKTTDRVFLTRTLGEPPDGRILQVWAHGPGEPAESVGLWPAGESVALPLPPDIAAVEGVLTLGVSEEPPGGSPTGSPTGRVFGTVDIPGVAGG